VLCNGLTVSECIPYGVSSFLRAFSRFIIRPQLVRLGMGHIRRLQKPRILVLRTQGHDPANHWPNQHTNLISTGKNSWIPCSCSGRTFDNLMCAQKAQAKWCSHARVFFHDRRTMSFRYVVNNILIRTFIMCSLIFSVITICDTFNPGIRCTNLNRAMLWELGIKPKTKNLFQLAKRIAKF
jgi:hypothetical protein